MTPTQRQAMEMAVTVIEKLQEDTVDTFAATFRKCCPTMPLEPHKYCELDDSVKALRAALAEQGDAIKAAWLAGYTEGEKAAWAGQDADKADMTADSTEVRPGFHEWHGGRYAGLQLAIAQAAWDAAVAAERERCAKHLDALGCDHCAAALRMSPNAKLGDGKQ